jgi:diaminohydroxyphosphoribosylaminopyrimidine deaminase/5-amino-6-(5-phosphoribosylamino)uracil reductase
MDDFNSKDRKYMDIALSLAQKGRYDVCPNPMVGALIVKDDRILAKGYHKKAGLAHAEIEAISNIKKDSGGKTLYVTLEPCNIWAKTPPCTDAIIKGGFSDVVIACLDPNPKINGAGIKALEKAGIRVRCGLLKERAERLNEIFFKHIRQKLPFVCAKMASSIDGKTAADDSSSKWITSDKAREMVQDLRRQYRCIATGINTIICDDATLLPRIKGLGTDFFINYHRVVFDSDLRISLDSNIVRTADVSKVIIFSKNPDKAKQDKLAEKGVDVININIKAGDEPFLKTSMRILYERYGIVSVLIESGQTLLSSFLGEGLVDKFLFFLAPKIIGKSRYGLFDGFEIEDITKAYELVFDDIKKTGTDIVLSAYPRN